MKMQNANLAVTYDRHEEVLIQNKEYVIGKINKDMIYHPEVMIMLFSS